MFVLPIIVFSVIGDVLDSHLDYLVKLGILVTVYLVAHIIGKCMFDDRLMNILPMAVYLATKV